MKIKNIIYALSLTVVALFATSCNDIVDYNDNWDNQLTSYGPPSIRKIATPYDTLTALSTGALTQMIIIQGNNLTDVKSILFNDVEVDLSTIYAMRHKITLPIPRILPENVTNTLTVETEKGITTFPFEVTIPPLVVKGFYNEFVQPGDTAQIVGDFLDLYEITEELGTFTLNGSDVKVLDFTDKSFSIIVPEGTPDNSVFTLSSPKLDNSMSFKYRDLGIQILNYEDLNSNGMWAGGEYVTDGTKPGDPEPLVGKYTRFAGSFGAWAWTNVFGGGFNLNEADIANNPQDYYVKFEILTKQDKPINDFEKIIMQNMDWYPSSGGLSFNTYGKWMTVTLNATDVFKDDNAPTKSSLAVGWNGFGIVHQPANEVSPDFSICNFRFIKK